MRRFGYSLAIVTALMAGTFVAPAAFERFPRQFGQSLERKPAQPLPLDLQPIFEAGIASPEVVQEIAAVERYRALQSLRGLIAQR